MRSIEAVKEELNNLSRLMHPFIVNLNYAFHDQNNCYMVMEYLSGGDLRYHLNRDRLTFTENMARFVIACLVLGLEFLHQNGVIFRDIRPENVMFDAEGYCRLVDFGMARTWRHENYTDTSGHPGYIAPELMLRKKPWKDDSREVYMKDVLDR